MPYLPSFSDSFQLTTSRRGRRIQDFPLVRIHGLSTHDLTQRSTTLMPAIRDITSLSTHDLTQRSTKMPHFSISGGFLSTHDLTQRSTRLPAGTVCACGLSTHDLTQRSTCRCDITRKVHGFQLTTSRRGRRKTCVGIDWTKPFNSRPHAEVDDRGLFMVLFYRSFNSRPHAEVDIASNFLINCCFLSTHDLTQRSTSLILAVLQRQFLSTHDLTQRSTSLFFL